MLLRLQAMAQSSFLKHAPILFSLLCHWYLREDLKPPSRQCSEEPGTEVSSWVHGAARVESERTGKDNDQEANGHGLQASGDTQVSGVKHGKDDQKEEHGRHHLERGKVFYGSVCLLSTQSHPFY